MLPLLKMARSLLLEAGVKLSSICFASQATQFLVPSAGWWQDSSPRLIVDGSFLLRQQADLRTDIGQSDPPAPPWPPAAYQILAYSAAFIFQLLLFSFQFLYLLLQIADQRRTPSNPEKPPGSIRVNATADTAEITLTIHFCYSLVIPPFVLQIFAQGNGTAENTD